MLPEVSNDHKEWLTSELTLRQWRSYIKKNRERTYHVVCNSDSEWAGRAGMYLD